MNMVLVVTKMTAGYHNSHRWPRTYSNGLRRMRLGNSVGDASECSVILFGLTDLYLGRWDILFCYTWWPILGLDSGKHAHTFQRYTYIASGAYLLNIGNGRIQPLSFLNSDLISLKITLVTHYAPPGILARQKYTSDVAKGWSYFLINKVIHYELNE